MRHSASGLTIRHGATHPVINTESGAELPIFRSSWPADYPDCKFLIGGWHIANDFVQEAGK